jgi:hypothetical protein
MFRKGGCVAGFYAWDAFESWGLRGWGRIMEHHPIGSSFRVHDAKHRR